MARSFGTVWLKAKNCSSRANILLAICSRFAFQLLLIWSNQFCIAMMKVSIYMSKINNWNTRTVYKICPDITIKAPERWRQWGRSGVFIVNSEHISHVFVNSKHISPKRQNNWCFGCWLWTSKYWSGCCTGKLFTIIVSVKKLFAKCIEHYILYLKPDREIKRSHRGLFSKIPYVKEFTNFSENSCDGFCYWWICRSNKFLGNIWGVLLNVFNRALANSCFYGNKDQWRLENYSQRNFYFCYWQ